jgi:hypothetical protein
MNINDLTKIEITKDMLEEATLEAEWLETSKTGNKTIKLTDDYNIVGSLGHQAVEKKLESSGLDFKSFRKEKYIDRGDYLDIQFNEDLLDVKSHKGTLDEKWFYNQSFLVMTHQIEKLKKEVSHLCFVLVDLDNNYCYLYGVISVADFIDKALPKKLKYDNFEIKAKDLRPFDSYIFKV